MRTYSLVLVDDHNIFRDALKFLLGQTKGFRVIGEASNGAEFLETLGNLKPDLVLMDISMPVMNGIEATRQALIRYPDLKVLALSMHGDDTYYFQMLEVGVKGFVLKESDSDELIKAIHNVLEGGNYFSNHILCKIIRDYKINPNSKKVTQFSDLHLSKRENEVLGLICAGYSNYEIAEKLGISKRTIEGHRSNLLSKTGMKNSVNLVLYAKKNKMHFDL